MNRTAPPGRDQQSERNWYARRQGVVRGPFSAENISSYILLGRIRLDDELSQDRVNWSVAGQLESLLPAELASQSSWDDYERLLTAHMKVDERKGDRRCRNLNHFLDSHSEQRKSPERRGEGNSTLLSQYLYVRMMPAEKERPDARRLRRLLLTMLLAMLVLAWFNPVQS